MSDLLERMRHNPAGNWTIHDVEGGAEAHITKWHILA
jgi:hypothetical protein